MQKRPTRLAGPILSVLVGLLAARPASADCARCHHQEADAFAASVHGRNAKGQPADAACETCHGDGTRHSANPQEAGAIRVLAGRPGAEACLSCHDKVTSQSSFRNGIHANSETVNCLSCHSIHSAELSEPKLLVKASVELCATCHPAPARSFVDKPFRHPLGRGGLTCASCHDPHGRPMTSGLRLTRQDELPCVECHAVRRGPHVYEHLPAGVGDCRTCHEAHGSPNPRQLKRATVAGLCLECHSRISTATLGAQPPSFHNLGFSRYQSCTTCHVAIHGSNRSPQLLK